MLTPERSIEVQRLLGSDIVMQFDELVPPDRRRRRSRREAMDRSIRWARRSRDEFDRGGDHAATRRDLRHPAGRRSIERLRQRSADALIDIGFDGYAVGGLAVGEGQEAMLGCLDFAPGQLPADKPRYLMGVGKPDDIVEAVRRGIDMFDCVLPTRSGRNGPGVHRRRADQHPQRQVRRGPGADRAGLRLPGLRDLLTRLRPPPRPLGRDPRRDADDRA